MTVTMLARQLQGSRKMLSRGGCHSPQHGIPPSNKKALVHAPSTLQISHSSASQSYHDAPHTQVPAGVQSRVGQTEVEPPLVLCRGQPHQWVGDAAAQKEEPERRKRLRIGQQRRDQAWGQCTAIERQSALTMAAASDTASVYIVYTLLRHLSSFVSAMLPGPFHPHKHSYLLWMDGWMVETDSRVVRTSTALPGCQFGVSFLWHCFKLLAFLHSCFVSLSTQLLQVVCASQGSHPSFSRHEHPPL